jgi:UDP-glucose:(heptosyl)LPS alpha-1,3-glucosyltransferase
VRVGIFIRKWSVRGGNERVATELAEQLQMRGHEVIVVCQKIDPSATARPIRFERVRGIAFDPTLAMITFAWSAGRARKRLERARAIDVSIGFNHTVRQDVYRLGGGTHAELLALAEHMPALRSGHIIDRVALDLERRRFTDGALRRLIAPSHRVKDELMRHYAVDPARIDVIWNGIDPHRFHPEPDTLSERQAVRKDWGVGVDEPVILFVGQDLVRKGFDLAVRVADAMDVRLVYVGKADRPRGLGQNVIWANETRAIEKAYRAADVLLAPSRYDPFGGVVLEALASGLLAVASRRIGATERAHGTALDSLFVADPEDVTALRACTEEALDPARRPALLAAAREVTKNASLDAWGEAMIVAIANACGVPPQ